MPRVSIDAAKKASLRVDILEEMNRRMIADGHSTGATLDLLSEMSKKRAREPEEASEVTAYSRFAVAHEREFSK